MLLIFFFAYPIGYGYRFIRGKWMRHAYSIILGVFLHLFMFKEEAIHFWALDVVVYLILTFIDRKRQAWVVFITCMAHLSLLHIRRVIFDYGGWSMDATTFLMPLVSRLSSLGFVYADGRRMIEQEKNKTKSDLKDTRELSDDQKERLVKDKPTLIEIFSYTSYPAANMCGPFFEFRDYIDFIEENDRYKNIPQSFQRSFKKLFQGLFFLVLCIGIPFIIDVREIVTIEFYELPYYYQLLKFMAALIAVRTTYYVAWYINDGSITLSGLSYNGKDSNGIEKFDRINCADALGVELCTSPRDGIKNWNSQTAEWLRHYLYNRLVAKKYNNTSATLLTNLGSAFWHGFYPVYYQTF